MNASIPTTEPALDTLSPAAADAMTAAREATARIAPLWPLKTFVAVNPFLGLAERRFEDAAAAMAAAGGARTTMPRGFYLEAIDAGRIEERDLVAARAEVAGPAARTLPSEPMDLIALARSTPGAAPVPLKTAADVTAEISGRDWPALMLERIAAFAADHFDEGQAAWRAAVANDGVYAAWRRFAAIDRTPEAMGLAGFRHALAGLPGDADTALAHVARDLGLGGAALATYHHRLLMAVGGWSAYARYQVWQSELYGHEDDTLIQFLAVIAAWDWALWTLHRDAPGAAEAWAVAADAVAQPPQADRDLALDCLLQTAFDKAWQRSLIMRFDAGNGAASGTGRPALQAAFCIDVRSEVFRRALETAAPGTETIGFAGFFGFPVEYVPLGHDHGGAQCPVLLTPSFTVREAVAGADGDATRAAAAQRMTGRRIGRAWKSFKMAAVSSFAFVETAGLAYAAKLVTDGFGLTRPVPHPATDGIAAPTAGRLGPVVDAAEVAGRATGFSAQQKLDMAAGVLKAMSLTDGFARIVMLAGHGSSTVNNPHASGLDCGACGGHTGEANARIAAAILNDPAVRSGLAERGLVIPDDTVFVAALHDTTVDEVRLFDTDCLPDSHAADLAELIQALSSAGALARAERATLLNLGGADPEAAIPARSRDWAQVRPEWGLAGCAAFVAAPRARTRGLDLDGRAFLHDYEWRQDAGFGTLELIMTAPMVVASWISLQYYGSTVDNRVFGSGDKVLHNVVGTLGVLEGNGGDLRTGLPWQSVHDGEKPIHEPLRLAVAIEAPIEAMNAVIERHADVRNLLDNGWLYLFAIDDNGRMAWRYTGGGWQTTTDAEVSEAA